MDKFSLSIKSAWYGLIFLVVFLPFFILLSWGSLVFHDILLEEALQQEQVLQNLVRNNVNQEVLRLTTMLENKSDPMAYTLSRERDGILLYELLKKVISREPSIHILLLIAPDGKIITGRETYDVGKTSMSEMQLHWDGGSTDPDVLDVPMQGKVYVGPTGLHDEGVFFTIAVPVIAYDKPLGVLMAEIDANVLWDGIEQHMNRETLNSYIVDATGKLLVASEESIFDIADDVSEQPLVNAVLNNELRTFKKTYKGLQGKQIFGSSMVIEDLGWHIITEIEQSRILNPIRELIYKLAGASFIIIIFFLILGMHLVRRVLKVMQLISDDFNRIAKQDFAPSKLSSSLKEVDNMVQGFNRMVREIARRQQGLNQAAIVFDNTSEGICITDTVPRIVSVNNAFTEITGYSEEEVIGKNPSILQSGQTEKDFYQNMWETLETDGCWRGEVKNRRKNGDIYTELLSINSFKDENGIVSQYVGVFTDISSIKETEHKLEYLAHHDALTDLPNRLLCNARLEHELQTAQRHGQLVAVMFLDLDMFKNVNDSLGHVLGDKLLQKVTARMSGHVRDEDTVARLGGDEFVLIVGSLAKKEDAVHFANSMLELFLQPFVIDEHEIFIGVSIGISIFPEDASDPETMLRNADTAMYRAKAEGRNNFQFYTAELTSNAHERLNMETYLRHALEKNELVLHYQPQYSLATGGMVAVEALIRWQHPVDGLINPDRFLAVAEETGLIIPIGEWVLRTACRQLKKWQLSGCPSFRMAVNLSARQFWQSKLTDVVKDVLEETGVQASQLDLELTESIIMRDTKVTIDTLNNFHEMGIELSIDDFGTGYSSLSYLKRFPIDRLKIDRTFVRDITTDKNDADMIKTIIALGHCMGLQVLAEGVETEEQLNYLKEHGCDEVQGYFYSQPVPAEMLEMLCNKDTVESSQVMSD
ncbi:MAG: EAL domain-containing protein [Gammaproteobacteria bacterium]|nr:EAL domain-containing protein [Gammaproteobacteria bacterium]MCW8924339.1 EAL domain-containing protein [Gammaproteobacteria bacterium]